MNFAVDIKCIKIIKRLWKNIWIIFCCKTRGVMLGMERVFVANWFMFYVRQLGKHQGNLRSLINIFTMSSRHSTPLSVWLPSTLHSGKIGGVRWTLLRNFAPHFRLKAECCNFFSLSLRQKYSLSPIFLHSLDLLCKIIRWVSSIWFFTVQCTLHCSHKNPQIELKTRLVSSI